MAPDVYAQLARIASALASPVRLRALNLLFQGSKSIEALSLLLDESEANTAAHMKALRAAGLVTGTRRGKYVYLEPSDDTVLRLFLSLREAGERVNDGIRLLATRDDEGTSPVSLEDLEPLLSSRRVLLIDLRPESEFTLGHIPGARSAPLAVLEERARGLPARRRILAYCRGKYCAGTEQGVGMLRALGLRAERLRFGVAEWRASGRALSVGAQA